MLNGSRRCLLLELPQLARVRNHDPAVGLHRAVRVAVEEELRRAAQELSGLSPELPEHLVVNGAGDFEVGGPEGDNGLSGKKLVIDAYGPRVPIGGGAWSGKDFFKADRAGGLHARRVAKAIVQLGLARQVRVVLGWFPGDREARVLRIETDDGRRLDAGRLGRTFDLSLRRSGTGGRGKAKRERVPDPASRLP